MTIAATGSVPGAVPVGIDLPSGARRPTAASGFSVPEFEVARPAQSTEASGALGDVGALLALQEDAGGTNPARQAADREARRHGRDLLRALSDLQRALLGAGGLADSLERLDTLLQGCPNASDPELGQAIRAIRLRAELERYRLRGAAEARGAGGGSPP
jgi:hypothetical protein